MQTLQNKIFVFFIGFLFTNILAFSNSEIQSSINQADSLYLNKKYTESFLIYDSIFSIHKSYSPQMLMKMSYIKEGIGEYENALYYLNYLYIWHPDQSIADKMEALATKHQLKGFTSSELDILFQVFTNYKQNITFTTVSLIALCIAITVFIRIKSSNTSYSLLGVTIALGILLFAFNNLNPFHKKAIIAQDNSLIMTDASSASNFIQGVKKGNRISIIKEQDNWYQIEIDDTTGFIKKNNLKVIEAY